MKEKLLTSNDFHNEWEKIEEKHDKIINCCGIPKLERRWHTREKFSNYETDLQQLLNNIHSVQEDRVGVEEFMEIDDWDDFPEDWTPICRREEECCKKTKEENCYFCN